MHDIAAICSLKMLNPLSIHRDDVYTMHVHCSSLSKSVFLLAVLLQSAVKRFGTKINDKLGSSSFLIIMTAYGVKKHPARIDEMLWKRRKHYVACKCFVKFYSTSCCH